MEREPGEQGESFTREIDPRTGTVERVDKEKKARDASENPNGWREREQK